MIEWFLVVSVMANMGGGPVGHDAGRVELRMPSLDVCESVAVLVRAQDAVVYAQCWSHPLGSGK